MKENYYSYNGSQELTRIVIMTNTKIVWSVKTLPIDLRKAEILTQPFFTERALDLTG